MEIFQWASDPWGKEILVRISWDLLYLFTIAGIAFLVVHLSLMTLAGLILGWAWNLDEVSTRVFLLLLAIIVITGFLAVGYIIGQAGLDKYTRLAQIAVSGLGNGNGTTRTASAVLTKATKGLVKAPEPTPEAEPEEDEPDESETVE